MPDWTLKELGGFERTARYDRPGFPPIHRSTRRITNRIEHYNRAGSKRWKQRCSRWLTVYSVRGNEFGTLAEAKHFAETTAAK